MTPTARELMVNGLHEMLESLVGCDHTDPEPECESQYRLLAATPHVSTLLARADYHDGYRPKPRPALAHASDGCCAGHDCDRCMWCLRGRCCRVDDPGYSLPAMGEWQPVHGELAAVKEDGERIQCHACGGWYRTLTQHAWLTHDMTSAEYRALFGLGAKHTMTSSASSARLRAASERSGLFQEHQGGPFPPMVPEQRAQFVAMAIEKRRAIRAAKRAAGCQVDGCGAAVFAKSMCGRHYRRQYEASKR